MSSATTLLRPLSSSQQQVHWIQLLRKCAAPISSLVLYFAPLSTILQITKDHSVGNLPLLPYTSMLSNNIVWAMYGILKREPIIMAANGIGVLLSFFYFVQYIRVLDKTPSLSKSISSSTSSLPGSVRQHVTFVVAVTLIVVLLAISEKTTSSSLLFNSIKRFCSEPPTEILGRSGMILTMTMFASPLSTVRTVLHTKSAASIPLPVTIASIANNYLWGIVGYLDMDDSNIYSPAIVGLAFSLIQLALKLWFREERRIKQKP